ncbi:MAG: PAS domain-containing protein, partial [Flavisolibacter sp.]
LNNYFRSTELAQIFVDNDLRIRKFNPTAVKMVNLIETDVGRPIDHISTNIKDSSLVDDINNVIKTSVVVEKEVFLTSGRASLMRILPYIRQDNATDGAVVTFIDISRVKELDNIIKAVFNSSLSAIMAFKVVRNEQGEPVDFVWIAANYEADKVLNKSQSKYIGKSLKEEFPDLVKKGIFSKAINIVKTGLPLRTEIQLNISGKTQWFELAANQMVDGLVITLTNIDEKKKVEEKFRHNYHELIKAKENYRNLSLELEEKVNERTLELSQSEERFRLIANTASDAIWDWDLVNNRIWWSESFYNRFGFERNEQSSTGNFWLQQVHEQDRERVNEEIQSAINFGRDWSARYRLHKTDGSFASIQNKGTVLKDVNGTPYRMVGAMIDVTESEIAAQQLNIKNEELQKVLDEFRFVTNFIPQMVWATRPDGYTDYHNKQWFDYTGLSPELSDGDNNWNSVVHPEDQQKAWKSWKHTVQTGETYEIEYRLRRYDGEYRWFLARALPLRDEKNKIVKWFGTCTDIHDQKMLNEILEQKVKERTVELQKANMELESSNTELLQFASVASHDLKEPLRKIHIFSNLVKDRYLANMDGAADYLERIISASARMTKLINDLLTFTRLSVNASFENVSLNRLVDEVMSDLELAITEKHATIEVDDLPKVDAITGQIRQVFQNIISNALKFTRKDEKPRIKITCDIVDRCAIDAKVDKDGEFCRIVIKDNGIGFDNQYAEKIFTIFQRLHSREQYDGTGIGLAITKKIIERHKGLIAATGKENEGSRFVIVLPLKQELGIQVEMSSN